MAHAIPSTPACPARPGAGGRAGQIRRRGPAGGARRVAAVGAAVLTALGLVFASAAPGAATRIGPPNGLFGFDWTNVETGQPYTEQPYDESAYNNLWSLGWAKEGDDALTDVGSVDVSTPLHPEAITHPEADFMGSTLRASGDSAVLHSGPVRPKAAPQLPGIDVSSYQGNVDWASIASRIDFVYAKATEGTYYKNPYFGSQYDGSYNSGLLRGAYTFAIPSNSSGAAQAEFFVRNGGGWSADGRTLPGALDIEYNPYGAKCYGLTPAQMVTWIRNFVNEYASLAGVYPVIYSTADWWRTCTNGSTALAAADPLWIANYSAGTGGPLPGGWGFYTFWQYADSGPVPGDQDVFNGAYAQLQTLARMG